MHHSLIYLLQVHFALSSSPVFSGSDTVSDTKRFYLSVLELFNDVEEHKEVNDCWPGGIGMINYSHSFTILTVI